MINFLNSISPVRLWRRYQFKRNLPKSKLNLIEKLIKGNHILLSFQISLDNRGLVYSIKESSFRLRFGNSLFSINGFSLKKDKVVFRFNSNLDNSSVIESLKEGILKDYIEKSFLTIFSDSSDAICMKYTRINYYNREVEYEIPKAYTNIYAEIYSRLTATERERVYVVLSETPYEQR